MSEEWKSLKDVVINGDHYEISNLGNIRSVERYVQNSNGITKLIRGKILKKSNHTGGYDKITLMLNGRISIIVLESSFDGVVNSTNIFSKLIGCNKKHSRYGDDQILESGNKKVSIIKISDYDDGKRLRGLSPNYIINNTDYDEGILGLRTK